jgi:uncharacterized protein (TIGR01777 family)
MSTVLISGASGFIGSHLVQSLKADGHRVARLVRKGSRPTNASTEVVGWDPIAGFVDRDSLASLRPDAVVNLAGESIAQRWTDRRRRAIRDSRVLGTTGLSQALASLTVKPKVMVSGSAMGYYGAHRGDEVLDEDSAPGSDFLAQTARDWEDATRAAVDAGIRVVFSRTGLVVGRSGGALQRMLPAFKLGLGGRLGSGRQWMSWIALDDTVRALRFMVDSAGLHGPVNLVAPEPVQNAEFTKTLARVIHRPAILLVPTAGLRMVFGSMADNTLLASQRMTPKRLAGAGFVFRHPRLEEALRFELTRSDDRAGR